MPERKKLLRGFKIFREKYYENSTLMQDLVKKGAQPDFFVIHCIDPRSGAGTVFNSDPGSLFGNRVMAALVPPYKTGSSMAASLSCAIKDKKVKHVIILGHTHCGGIKALVEGSDDKSITLWMDKAKTAFKRAKSKVSSKDKHKLCAETEKQTIILGLKNLLSYPDVKQAFEAGSITLNGWLYDLESGDILGYDPGKDEFISLMNNFANGVQNLPAQDIS